MCTRTLTLGIIIYVCICVLPAFFHHELAKTLKLQTRGNQAHFPAALAAAAAAAALVAAALIAGAVQLLVLL